MSGRSKKILYHAADYLLLACAFAGSAWTFFAATQRPLTAGEIVAAVLWCISLVLQLPALIHETGHLLFGILAGMKPLSFSFWCIRFAKGERPRFARPDFAGKTEMFPKGGAHIRGRTIFYTAGGAAFNLLVGGALLAVFLLLPHTNFGVLYAGLLAPFFFYEGVRALLPAQLPAGKTDGAVLLGLIEKAPEEEIMVRVLTAQGILYRGTFSEVPKEILFDVPVVREDLPAFHALTMLRLQFLLGAGDVEGAMREQFRLKILGEYLSESEKEELGRYEAYFSGKFESAPSPFYGICRLEERLAADGEKIKNSARGQNWD